MKRYLYLIPLFLFSCDKEVVQDETVHDYRVEIISDHVFNNPIFISKDTTVKVTNNGQEVDSTYKVMVKEFNGSTVLLPDMYNTFDLIQVYSEIETPHNGIDYVLKFYRDDEVKTAWNYSVSENDSILFGEIEFIK